MRKNIAIIVCSGVGKRMESNIPKQFIEIDKKPIVAYTLDKFENCEKITDIIVVTNKNYISFFENDIIKKYNYKKVKKVVEGGKERLNSVYEGIKCIQSVNDDDIILIHDGVRPFIEEASILKIIEETKKYDATVLGVKVKDTIKVCFDNIIQNTPNRDSLWIAQTPQCFKYKIIKKCYDNVINTNTFFTDDASVVEYNGYKVKMVEGTYSNIKITTKEDLLNFK